MVVVILKIKGPTTTTLVMIVMFDNNNFYSGGHDDSHTDVYCCVFNTIYAEKETQLNAMTIVFSVE